MVAQPTPGAPAVTQGRQSVGPVPNGFIGWTTSARFGAVQFMLGSGRCDVATCPVLLVSRDSGATWSQTHAFDDADVSSAVGEAQPVVQPAGSVSDITFANARTGYVFGSDLWVTHDGGRSFTQVAHPGASVLDVVIRGDQAFALTAAGCVQGVCSGRLEVSRISGGSQPNLTATIAAVSPPDPVTEGHLLVAGSSLVLVSSTDRGAGESSVSWRLDGDALTPVTTGAACSGKPLDAAASTLNGRLFALCDSALTPQTASFSTVTSTDGGASWHLVGSGNATLPTQGRVTIAARDDSHVVVTSGGPREALDGTTRSSSGAAAIVSGDGGAHFSSAHLEGGPKGGFDSVSFDGSTWNLLSRLDGDVWRSSDDGVRFSSHATRSR